MGAADSGGEKGSLSLQEPRLRMTTALSRLLVPTLQIINLEVRAGIPEVTANKC